MTDGEAGSPGRRDPSLWKLGTDLPDRIAAICGLDACPQRLLHHVVLRLKRDPLNFRPKFPEPLWSDGLKVLDGPISIDWQNWTGEILVQDWIALGDSWEGWEDGAGWREAARQLGIDAIDADDLLAVHGKTFPIEIFDEAIKEVVAAIGPRLAREFGAPLVISLDGGKTYPSPDDWPHLPSAEPGEALAAFWDRAIVGDPFLQSVTAHTSRNLKDLPLAVARTAELTFAWWQERWPDRVFYRSYDESPGNYHRDRVYWRLVVELCERLRAEDLVMKGHRTDVSAYPLEVVEQGLFRNPFMMLRPRIRQGGWFRPEQWHGSEPPQSLPSYHELTLWPAETTETKQKAPPGVPYPKLLRWWTTDYLPRYPEPDKRPNVETQRTDAAAAFPDHTPPTERTMKRLRADKDTPPEWRDVGRRPKSD